MVAVVVDEEVVGVAKVAKVGVDEEVGVGGRVQGGSGRGQQGSSGRGGSADRGRGQGQDKQALQLGDHLTRATMRLFTICWNAQADIYVLAERAGIGADVVA